MDPQSWSIDGHDLDIKVLAGIGIVGLLFFYLISSVVIQWYRLRHIPGPFIDSITTLRSFYWLKRSDFNTFVLDLQKDYGEIVRLTPTGVMISDPDVGWRINSARSAYNRSGWYESMKFNPWGGTVLTEMNPVSHDKRKSKLIHGFAGKSLQHVERSLDVQIETLKDVLKTRIEEAAASGKQGKSAALDIGRILHYFQVDLITYTGLGESWGDLTQDKDHYNYIEDGNAAMALAHACSMVPAFRRIVFSDAFLKVFGPSLTSGWLG